MSAPVFRRPAAAGPPQPREESVEKVTGAARYAYEYPQQEAAYAWIVTSPIAKGRVLTVDADHVLRSDDVIAVLRHDNAPRLEDVGDPALAVLQDPAVAYRGQVVALVVAKTPEAAREAAATLPVEYEELGHDVVLTPDHESLYQPDAVNPDYPADTEQGDPDGAFEASPVRVDHTYRTVALHNNPMEPHATTALWHDDGSLTLYDSNQGGHVVRQTIAGLFGLAPDRVRVMNPHVGGGFGSKGTPRPNVVLAAMAAQVTGRPVKIAVTRQQMFSLVGYRTPTIQRVRLGAEADGRLNSITHEVVEQTSTVKEFAEQTAVATRSMYAAPHRRTSHRLARLDVPVPSWMRAPGECPGFFAFESALDELAAELGMDPIDLRVRNEPETDPESGKPFSSRNLVACLRQGAERFGWEPRPRAPRTRRDGRWLIGTGVASSYYPTYEAPATATVSADENGHHTVAINATDIGTGARTALHQLAAEALDVPWADVTVRIGDSDLPQAGLAGGSMGTRSWGWAVTKACRALREQGGGSVTANTAEDIKALGEYSRAAYGAQFVEVRVNQDTGELRVPRMTGVFAAGRIVNSRTARSQFIGGMTMGLSMALHEEGVMDAAFGDYANHDLASYHVAACADVGTMDIAWIEEDDEHLGGTGTKGIGEIGIVGTAAAVANAVYDATGVRVRDLPIHLEDLLA
ncbi:xanthine dehydrogenase family protein molybdopterin-binding subunit [Kineosporia sp. J2-2]|uniref:Xanthine dehydrogenase family protein molybdopterin-binding subunit n=1 Tax=Kineosporia corallincola TaxID=2835133 RepID=A0ABS5TEX4_9ACTN|nr:xanthine dehydrogenase family protein molybdopterin-binding subunit [Kineosporia corallincola]MBT0769600.1 xanthine dehydrogenase family protein molybdopterin-binding subunit [Kineosporia corallincola]